MSTIHGIQTQTDSFFLNKSFIKLQKIVFITIFSLVGFYLLFLGPITYPDTTSYTEYHILRSPLYPLLLKTFSLIFGNVYFVFCSLFQILLGLFAAGYLSLSIRKIFNLNFWCAGILFLIIFSPYIGPGKIGNTILSEALCYPLFLFIFAFLLKGMIQRNTKSLLISIALTTLLILTRRQFLFLYPAFGIILAYIIFFELKKVDNYVLKGNIEDIRNRNFTIHNIALLTIALIISIASSNLLEKTYHYINNGRFTTSPFTGIQLVVAPLYLAKDSDVQFLSNDLQKEIFLETRNRMHEKKLSFDSLKKTSYFDVSVYNKFYESYNLICWETLSLVLNERGISDPYVIDTLTTDMALKLIQHNFIPFFILYLLNIILNLGGYYYALLLIALFFAALVYLSKKDDLSIGLLLSLLLTAGNYSLVGLVEPILRRYSMYTDTIQISIILVLCFIAFKNTYVRHNR